MSKRFKTQDYFRYPAMGTKWRRPKGRQSKMRRHKGGAGAMVQVGFGTSAAERNKINGMHFIVVRSMKDLDFAKEAVIISSSIGSKKTLEIAKKARELRLHVLNMKKIHRADKIESEIKKNKEKKAKEKKERKEKKLAKGEKKDEKKEEKKAESGKPAEKKVEEKSAPKAVENAPEKQ